MSHSHRKATIGFTLLADLAGSRVAINATRTSNSVTTTNDASSQSIVLASATLDIHCSDIGCFAVDEDALEIRWTMWCI